MMEYCTIQAGVFPVNNLQDLSAAALAAVDLVVVDLAAVALVEVGKNYNYL
jgi:hypothetical protein